MFVEHIATTPWNVFHIYPGWHAHEVSLDEPPKDESTCSEFSLLILPGAWHIRRFQVTLHFRTYTDLDGIPNDVLTNGIQRVPYGVAFKVR